MTIDRIPPHSLDAEKAVIGALLVDPAMLDVVEPMLRPTDFYALIHELIFSAITELRALGIAIDKISLAERLRSREQLHKIGGLPYLTACMEILPTAASADYYASLVREKANLRALITAGTQMQTIGFDGESDPEAAHERAESLLKKIVDRDIPERGPVSMLEALTANYSNILDRKFAVKNDDIILSPWPQLNQYVGGFGPGELVVIGAAPKMGKTAMVAMFADYISAKYGNTVLCALEMGIAATTRRIVAMYSRVSARKQRVGEINEFELEHVVTAQQALLDRRLFMLDLALSANLTALRRHLRILAKNGPIRAVIVDHVNFLGDVHVEGMRSSKSDRLDAVYHGLLKIAHEFGCVIVAVQHVNRTGYDTQPTMAMLRDGGNAEGHAHTIIMPYRPKPMGTPEERMQGEFVVAAAREGVPGIVPMTFVGERALWLQADQSHAWFESAPPEQVELTASLFGGRDET